MFLSSYEILFRSHGGVGAIALAKSVVMATKAKSDFKFLYPLDLPIVDKIEIIAKKIYGADGVTLSDEAKNKVALYTKQVGPSLQAVVVVVYLTPSKGWGHGG